jgi:hypothetical protein
LEPRIATLEKQIAVLVASTLTKRDLQVLENAWESKDAANWAKSNKAEAEGRELARKEMKRVEALVLKAEQQNQLTQFERQIAAIRAENKRLESLVMSLLNRK